MDERLRGKGNYTIDDLMNYCPELKNTWITLEGLLEEDYKINRLIIKDSKIEGWGINYRSDDKSLCYVHPEMHAIVVMFQIREEKIDKIKLELSEYALKVWENKYPCGKGGWMRYKITKEDQVIEVRKLLNAKISSKL